MVGRKFLNALYNGENPNDHSNGNPKASGTQCSLVSYTIHPYFSSTKYNVNGDQEDQGPSWGEHDVSVIKTAEGCFTVSENIMPICLPKQTECWHGDSEACLSSFGSVIGLRGEETRTFLLKKRYEIS